MTVEKRISLTLWYLITTIVIIYCGTILLTVQGCPWWGLSAAGIIGAFQVAGLIYNLHGGGDTSKPGIRAFERFELVVSVAPFFALLLCIFILKNQYHNELPVSDISKEYNIKITSNVNITIIETDDLYILFPAYSTVEFVSKDRPSKSDDSIILCTSGAFQKQYSLKFSHDNIEGYHAENGEFYSGDPISGMGAFTFSNGRAEFFDEEDAAEAVKRAAENGGWGFQQYVVIRQGKFVFKSPWKYRCYRALAEIGGRVCVIDSKRQMNFKDFAGAMLDAGVENAMYLDMGSGWNYAWYRTSTGSTRNLIGMPWPFSHNWIVFRK